MGPGHGFPVLQARHVDPGPHHVLEPAAQRLQGAGDLVDDGVGLRGRIDAAQHAAAVGGGRPRDADARPAADRPAIAGERLPARAAEAPAGAVGADAHLVRRREGVEVVAQVARGGQERRHAVLVAAVAGNRRQRRDRRLEPAAIVLVQRAARPAARCRRCAIARPAGRRRSPRPRPDCCITKRVATLAIDTPWRSATSRAARSTRCSAGQPPATRMKRPYFICDHVPVALPVGLGRAQPAIAEPAAAQRAVGQQRHVELLAHGRERARGAPVERATRSPGSRPSGCRWSAPAAGARHRRW